MTRIRVWLIVLGSACLYPAIAHDHQFWGLALPAAFPVGLLVTAVLVLLIAGLMPVRLLSGNSASGLASITGNKKTVTAAVSSVVLFVLFISFQERNLVLGDAYSIIERTLQGNDFAPFSVVNLYLHKAVLAMVGSDDPERIIMAYRLTSWLGGVVVLGIIWQLSSDTAEYLVAIAVLLSSALLQIFCGYVERYPIAYAILFAYCLIAYRDFRLRQVSVTGAILLLAAIALHLAAGVMVLSYLLLVIRRYRSRFAVTLAILAGIVLLAAAMTYARSIESSVSAFLLLTPQVGRPYALLTPEHVRDTVNILLLSSPLLLVLVFTRRFWHSEARLFHLLMLAPAFLFVATIDPKLGALRDWDLLSLFAVPALASTIVVLRELIASNRSALPGTLAVIFVFGFIHTGSWLYLNSSAIRGYEAMKSVVSSDLHYSPDADHGLMNVAWAKIAQNVFNDGHEGVAAQERRLVGDPSDSRNRYNLAVNQARLGDLARAETLVVGHWQEFDLNQRVVAKVAEILRQRQNHNELMQLLEAAIQRDPNNAVFAPELEDLRQRFGR